MVDINEEIPLIVMSKNGAEYGNSYYPRTSEHPPYYLKRNPVFEEVDSVIRDLVTDAETHRSTVVSTTVKAYRVYVNSVSGATVETDTGDGTKENPFQCFNSALKVFWQCPLHCADPCVCRGSFAYAEIIVSGFVDYSVGGMAVPYKTYYFNNILRNARNDWFLIIRGVNNPVFNFDVHFYNPGVYISRCNFSRTSGRFYLDHCTCTFDKCVFYSTLYAYNLFYGYRDYRYDFVFCTITLENFREIAGQFSPQPRFYECDISMSLTDSSIDKSEFFANRIEKTDILCYGKIRIHSSDTIDCTISMEEDGSLSLYNLTDMLTANIKSLNPFDTAAGSIIYITGTILNSVLEAETDYAPADRNPGHTFDIGADYAYNVKIKSKSVIPPPARYYDTDYTWREYSSIQFSCPLFEKSSIDVILTFERENIPQQKRYGLLLPACYFLYTGIEDFLMSDSSVTLNILFTGNFNPGSSIEYVYGPFYMGRQFSYDHAMNIIYENMTSSESSEPSIIYEGYWLNQEKGNVFSLNGSGEYHHDV